ncbi:MAG: hypothetical protein Q4Q53_02920 [Methanocorpusculum sp.]|nr:hypothetical protein [Methanocorpusculum sp.]
MNLIKTSRLIRLPLFIILCFASREKKKSDTRERIISYLEKNPGSQEKDIILGLKISRGSAAYQLFRLRIEKRIYSDSSLGHLRYYPCSVKPDSISGKLCAVSRNPKCSHLLTILSNNGSLTRREIAELMKMPSSAVYRYLKILQIYDLLIITHEGRDVFYSLADEAKNLRAEMNSSENGETCLDL